MQNHVVLTIRSGQEAGTKWACENKTAYTIGRSRDCELHLSAPEISRRHCQLAVELPHIRLRDLGSRNGTYVNGAKVRVQAPPPPAVPPSAPPEVELAPGDVIQIGSAILQVGVDETPTNSHAAANESTGEACHGLCAMA